MFDFSESTLFADALAHLGICGYSDDKDPVQDTFQELLLKDASDHVLKI